MKLPTRKVLFLVAVVAFCATALSAEDWPKFRRDNSNTGRSLETGIKASNVASLKLKWSFATGNRISAQPTVATVNGIRTVYIGNNSGVMYALNAATGAKIWSFKIDIISPCTSTNCKIGSSAAVQNGIVYFGAHNGYVYALNAASGTLLWKKQLGSPAAGYAIWSSPLVANGLVYIGTASSDDAPCIPGAVEALNATSGTQVWKFNTLDQTSCPSGTCVGAAVWSSPALDTANNILYITTGNPGSSCTPATANATRYPDSILAINATTGQLKNYFQAIGNDTLDFDFGSSPVLHTTKITNECTGTTSTRQWVTAYNKNSKIYTISRSSSGLGSTVQTVSVNNWGVITPPMVPLNTSSACSTTGFIRKSGNTYYVTTASGTLYRFNQSTTPYLTQIWSRSVSASSIFSSPTAISDLVFFGSFDSKLYAYTIGGSRAWSYTTGGSVASPPAISGGRVYIGSYDGKVYCFSINAQ